MILLIQTLMKKIVFQFFELKLESFCFKNSFFVVSYKTFKNIYHKVSLFTAGRSVRKLTF
jgi:hypothetical protein